MTEAAPTEPKKDEARPPRPERTTSRTQTTVIGGRTLTYTASAGTLNLKDDKGEERASIFYTSYVLDGVADPSKRPVTFCFNGGPGSSAVWLQLGLLGPRRIDIPDTVAPPPPPYGLVDNAFGLLDRTDLVFIDPVGTGFSRPLGKAKDEEFHSVKGDVESVGAFVERWTSRNHRWNSPKYVAGESYGTTRAAGLAHFLQQRGLFVNGLVLVSLALDFTTFVFESGNDLPNVLFLPTYAATAAYHGLLPEPPRSLPKFLDEVRAFATDEYAPALLKGTRLDGKRRKALAKKLQHYTGLDAVEIEARDLRIEDMWFAKQLLGSPGKVVGRLDSRYTGRDPDRHSPIATIDPSYDALYGPYAALINEVLRRDLGWDADEEYQVISMKVGEGWKWAQDKRLGFPHVVDDLRKALLANPHLRVLVANGLYDLATPFFASEYTVDHLMVDPEVRANVRLTFYEAGHMMYQHPASLAKLRADLVAFYDGDGPRDER